jgi:hypothetical protein
LTVEYKNILIDKVANTKFLGMYLITWIGKKKHTELILPNPSVACCAIRRLYYTLLHACVRTCVCVCKRPVFTYARLHVKNAPRKSFYIFRQ